MWLILNTHLFLIVAFALMNFAALGQTDKEYGTLGDERFGESSTEFIRGYILTISGDTIRGEIKDNRMQSLAQSVLFRTSEEENYTAYLPNELKGFFFGPSFHYRSIGYADTPNEVDQTKNLTKPMRETKREFLRILVEGDLDLYTTQEDDGLDYLLVKKDGEELFVRRRDSITGNEIIPDLKYIGLMRLMMKDCVEISQRKRGYKYTRDAMRKLVMDYNKCVGNEGSKDYGDSRPIIVSFSLLSGLKSEKLTIGLDNPRRFNAQARQLNSRLGLMVELKYFNKLGISTGLIYNRSSYSGVKGSSTTVLGVDINYESLEIPIFVKYDLYTGKVSPFICAGVRYGLVRKSEVVFNLTQEVSEEYSSLVDRSLGVEIGVGARYNINKSTAISLALSRSVTFYSDVFIEFWRNDDIILDFTLGYRI